jgi:hypothetical protein
MTDDDLVDLVFVTTNQNFLPVILHRKMASEIIMNWFEERERVRSKRFLPLLWFRAFCSWLRPSTAIYSEHNRETNESFVFWAVDTKEVIGMYVREREPSPHQLLAESQKRIADAIENQGKKLDEGDEWKNGGGEEDDS